MKEKVTGHSEIGQKLFLRGSVFHIKVVNDPSLVDKHRAAFFPLKVQQKLQAATAMVGSLQQELKEKTNIAMLEMQNKRVIAASSSVPSITSASTMMPSAS